MIVYQRCCGEVRSCALPLTAGAQSIGSLSKYRSTIIIFYSAMYQSRSDSLFMIGFEVIFGVFPKVLRYGYRYSRPAGSPHLQRHDI